MNSIQPESAIPVAAIIGVLTVTSILIDPSSMLAMFCGSTYSRSVKLLNLALSVTLLVSLLDVVSSHRADSNSSSSSSYLTTAPVSLTTGSLSMSYLFIFFGLSVISREDDEAAAVTPSSTPTKPRHSRSPIALVVIAAAIVLFLCFVVSFSYNLLPLLLATLATAAYSATADTVLHTLPWVLTVGAIVTLYIRERFLRQKALSASEAQAQHRIDEERLKTYPARYPNGWYKLLDSHDVAVGSIKQVVALDQVFAVFRGHDKEVHILDAYCPHLGANLAVGGTVEEVNGESCVTCPFHKWSFKGDGSVAHIPYTDKLPKQGAHAWPSMEYYGMILVYYDIDRRVPPYMPPRLEDIDNGSLVHRGRHVARDVRQHLQEFAENSSDTQHFDPLHGRMMVPWTSYSIPGITVEHVASWTAGTAEEGKHICHFRNKATLKIFGTLYPKTGANADITFVGPAGVVFFRITVPECGDIIVFQTHLPESPMLIKPHFSWFAPASMSRLLVSYVVGNWVSQWENDLNIWENKVFRPKALLVKGDGPMNAQRRWFTQFYSRAKAADSETKDGTDSGDGEMLIDEPASSAKVVQRNVTW